MCSSLSTNTGIPGWRKGYLCPKEASAHADLRVSVSLTPFPPHPACSPAWGGLRHESSLRLAVGRALRGCLEEPSPSGSSQPIWDHTAPPGRGRRPYPLPPERCLLGLGLSKWHPAGDGSREGEDVRKPWQQIPQRSRLYESRPRDIHV